MISDRSHMFGTVTDLIPRTMPYVARHLYHTWYLESNKRVLNTEKLMRPTHTVDDPIKWVGTIKT